MNQQRRLSPAQQSPIQRNTIISQHSNRFQFLQVTPTTHPVQYVSLQNYNEVRQVSKERETNQIPPYQQVCPKGFQSLRIMSQPDGNTSKSPVTPIMQSQPNIRPNQNSNSLQLYIDNALRNQRDEMLKLFEQQSKQIDYMHQQQQLIIQQQQIQQEKKKEQKEQKEQKESPNFQSQINQVKEQLHFSITQTCREMIHKLQKQEQTDFKALQVQIEKLKSQLFQINLSTSKQSDKMQQSYKGKENEPEEYQYKKHVNQRNSLDNYDQYIRKYEQFNKQVNDYLINRKIPDHLSSILNSSKDSNSDIHEIEYISSDHPLTDITNVQNIKQIKSQQQQQQPLQQIAQPSITQQFNTQKTTIQTTNQYEDSPIKALNEQMMIDSLDNINVHDPNNLQITKEEFDQLKSQRMSTIHENDDEDEELMYQVDENGFILSQDGHPLIDETGKRIQLTKQEMQFYKNKINS
ncbi:unnamed protein product [Paramecium sonneborni]|uniref:Uncharacterized protein n=1 Tax=Paramecium sonneborni TaxID=65129 RepID=A0A8S1LGH5_9CILI|nr:unnamed protein product [Paramecium sonneborni]